MRKLLLSSVFAVTLAACSSMGGAPLNLADFIAQVQATTSAVCSFLPTAETVANIVATGNPIVTTAGAVANAICAAVVPAKQAARQNRTAAPPIVAGVVIHGKFLN